MFWNKRRPSYPATPKMAPVSLPFDMPTPQWHRIPSIPTSVWRDRKPNVPQPLSSRQRHDMAQRPVASPPSTSGWYSDVERKPRITSMPSDVLPGRRSKTPHPALSKPRYDLPQAQAHRERKPSVVNGATDDILKPLKGILKQQKASVDDAEFVKPVVPAPYDNNVSSKLDETDDCLKPHKAALKGGGHLTAVHMQRSSSYAGYPGAYVPANYQQARPRKHSLAGSEAHATRPPPLDKYTVKTHVVRVVQKEEAIALSWPLTVGESSGRRRYPLVYFDIWFNPRYDPSPIKVYKRGFQDMSEEDRNLPVSSHCVLQEMDITCPVLQTSFTLKIRRPDGIRCIDVFQEIFDVYDHRLRSEERHALASGIDDRCIVAFQKRCKDTPHLPLVNERQGMRRVDLLRGKRIFNGLKRDPRSQTWILDFHRPAE